MRRGRILIALAALLCVGLMSATAFAAIDWKQSQGTEIRFLMNKHPFTTYIEPKVADFEKLTGIKVVIEAFPEDQYRNKRTIELNAGGKVDGYMIMPGQDDLYYWKAGWLQPLDAYIKDPALTTAYYLSKISDEKSSFNLVLREINAKLDRLAFTLESRALGKHEATLAIEGLLPGRYSAAAGESNRPFLVERSRVARIQLPLDSGQPTTVRIEPVTNP